MVGKGDKVRQVLIPAVIAARLLASRGDAPASAAVFESVRNPGHALTDRAVNFASIPGEICPLCEHINMLAVAF